MSVEAPDTMRKVGQDVDKVEQRGGTRTLERVLALDGARRDDSGGPGREQVLGKGQTTTPLAR